MTDTPTQDDARLEVVEAAEVVVQAWREGGRPQLNAGLHHLAEAVDTLSEVASR